MYFGPRYGPVLVLIEAQFGPISVPLLSCSLGCFKEGVELALANLQLMESDTSVFRAITDHWNLHYIPKPRGSNTYSWDKSQAPEEFVKTNTDHL